MNAEQYSAERSALDKKLEQWEGALAGQQYYHQHQHQECAPSQESAHHQRYIQQLQPGQQQQSAYLQHHATAATRVDGSLFQPDAPGTAFGNAKSTTFHASANAHNTGSFIMAHNIPPQAHTNRHTPSPAPLHLNSPPTDQIRTRPPPIATTPSPHTPIRDHRNHKAPTVVSGTPHRPERFTPEVPTGRVSNLSMVKSSSAHTGRRVRGTAMSAFTVRPTGTKDRHSKVRTAKGLRDRRVRLSAPTAIQFFDVQDRLGYDQPSKAVDWLIEKARAAIDELAPIQGLFVASGSTSAMAPTPSSRDGNQSSAQVKDEEHQYSIRSGIPIADPRAESRAKARERARERAKEKSTTSSPIPAASATAATTITSTSALSAAISSFPATPQFPSSPPNLHLLPEFLLLTSQFCQLPPPDHEMQRPLQPQDLSSILSSHVPASSATHLLPFASHFFPTPFTGSAAYFGDVPSMQMSAPPILYSSMNNSNSSNITPISPRGTLQSIFGNPTSSNAQGHMPQLPPVMMMGSLHANAYGAAALGSLGGCITSEVGDHQQSSSHERGSPDLHQHARIPMRIHGMELGSQEESRITPSSSMEAEL